MKTGEKVKALLLAYMMAIIGFIGFVLFLGEARLNGEIVTWPTRGAVGFILGMGIEGAFFILAATYKIIMDD